MTAAVFLPLTILNPGPALASSFDLQGVPVLFANGSLDEDIGGDAGVGFSHRYDDVVQFGCVSVDALVSLVSTTNLDSDDYYSDGTDNLIDYLDRSSSTNPNALRTQIDIASGPETIDIGEAVIRVAFVQAGTRIPLTLQNAVISVKDVDGSQFVEFTGISSYKLTSDTALQVATNTTNPNLVTAGSTRFLEPNGTGTASTDERNWVEVSYSQLSFIDIKIGAYQEDVAEFFLDFTAAGFTNTTNQVVVAAPSYTVTYSNNGSSETPPAATTGSGTVSIASAPNRTGYTFMGPDSTSPPSQTSHCPPMSPCTPNGPTIHCLPFWTRMECLCYSLTAPATQQSVTAPVSGFLTDTTMWCNSVMYQLTHLCRW